MCLKEDLWSNLPFDLLHTILSVIPLVDHPSFSRVCKHWKSVCVYKLHCIKQIPLLIHVKNWENNTLNYYSPSWNKTFMVQSPFTLPGSHFFTTRHGWLVLYRNLQNVKVEVLLFNPATNVSLSYPLPPRDYSFTGVTFSGYPGKEDFVIFGIVSSLRFHVSICVWKQGQWKLRSAHYDNERPFSMSPCSSPAVYNGNFYCMSENGKLGVFDPEKETWDILSRPKEFSVPTLDKKEVYLIESKGKFIAMVGGNHSPCMQIYCLNRKKRVWQRIESLEAQSLFVGPNACIIMDAGTRAMQNRVYTSRVYGKLEELDAELKILKGLPFFVTKGCDASKDEDSLRKGNCRSLLRIIVKMDKYSESVQYRYCAWYDSEI